MITKEEVEAKAEEFEIHHANVQRDYVFGWLLHGIYSQSKLKDLLVLKGGNCYRKAYFPNTRFSEDLDFSTQSALSEEELKAELDRVCDFIQASAGIVFEKDRNKVGEKRMADKELRVYYAKLYFRDFYGNPDEIVISVRMDITQFDRIYLPVQTQNLIHPYSDADKCVGQIKCVKLEELIASKLKCLLQRRRSHDLYDIVYAVFINKELDVVKREIVSTFLKKTIFGANPGVVKNLLLGLPFDLFSAFWEKYIVCPKGSVVDFGDAMNVFKKTVVELFGEFPVGRGELVFFPAEMRNIILSAGSSMTLLKIRYKDVERDVEPYSLRYKRRKDGVAREYLYVYDRVGGDSGPGPKSLVHTNIQEIHSTDVTFEPRHPVELSKAGEYADKRTFEGKGGARGFVVWPRASRRSSRGAGLVYVIECSYCGKRFTRKSYSTTLNEHKDKYGNRCYGRIGTIVDQSYR